MELPESVQKSGPHGADGREVQHETQEGQVFSVVFHAEDSGFSVIILETEGGVVTAAGELGEVHPGDYLRLHGRWREHPRFGRQFQAQWSEAATPTTLDGLQQYLASGAFSGIGADMAKRLVDHFGEHTLDALESGASMLQEVDGIGPKRATVLAEAFTDSRDRHRVLAELRGLGLRPAQAQKLYERWGPAAIERVRQDPYALIGSLRGIGFETAERIAEQLGIPNDSVVRARGVIQHRLREALGEGHTWLPETELEQRLGGRGLSVETVTKGLADLIREDKLACEVEPRESDELRWYGLPKSRDDESDLARHLARLMSAPHEALVTSEQVLTAMERAEFPPDESQRRALELALSERVAVMTGGPGTGKTTTLRLLLDVLGAAGLGPVHLASPTGRAAKRLQEATGREASTVHRLLGWDPIGGEWKHDEDETLDCAYLIVDEVSMLDLEVAAALLRAIPDNCCLLLVGDADQLPSVGAGAVLRDLVASPQVPTARLERVHRQEAGSGIVDAAHAVLHGQRPQTVTSPAGDFFLASTNSAEAAAAMVEKVVCERIPEKYGYDPRTEVLVLAPMYRGALGVDALNQRLSQRLNPDGEGADWARGLREGDRVMVVRNDYEREVFNGDAGVITHMDKDALYVEIDKTVHEYRRDEVGDLIPAYCVTVHRAQGSEARAVVIALDGGHFMMLRRNLLYTAITRGRELVTVVADPHALNRAVANADEGKRWTRLPQRLSENC
ncbi:MAG: ATP-dependent RecD-like DNA helicase [Planctomycetes bacterium]|nr:ATP-dependent RecD-like DNA helicase [Planctomycetota bacterium]